MPVNLIDATPYLSADRLKEMTGYLLEKFATAVKSRTNQIDSKYKAWMDNYSAKPFEEVRTTPWYRASNFVPQLIRMHCDILTARMVGIMFGTKPFWKPLSAMDIMPRQYLEALGMWMEFESFQRMDFYRPIRSGVGRTFKTGTNLFKAVWKDPAVYSFSVARGINPQGGGPTGGIQSKRISQEGMLLEPLPFDDFFVYPITVGNLDKVKIKFHRIRLAKEDVQRRIDTGLWDKGNAQWLLEHGDNWKPEPSKEAVVNEAGFSLTKDVVLPFSAIECWFEYVMADGQNFKLVAVLNPYTTAEKALLRFYFNYDAKGEDPFVDQRFAERDDFFYGYSIPEILEQTQEEAAQIHNARRDANTITGIPTFKKKRLADVPNPATDFYPGRTFEVENMDDMEPMVFGGNYNAMIEEESYLLNLASTYTGISNAQQTMGGGILEGKRGVYSAQGTMAMLQEGNDRPTLYLREFREPFHKIGRLMYRYNRDLRSTPMNFQLWGKNGAYLQNVFALPDPPDYDPVLFSLGASDGSANKEIDRTNLLLMANTMAGYYNQLMQLVMAVGGMPPESPIRETALMVLDGAKDLTDRLLVVFDIGDRNALVPDVRKIFGGGVDTLPGAEGFAGQAGLPEPQSDVSISALQSLAGAIGNLPGRTN